MTQIAHDQGLLLHVRLWQPRFWDRIVRDDAGLEKIRAYIRNNPAT